MSARTAFQSRVLLTVAQRNVESLAVTPNGQKLLVGTSDGSMQVYDVDGGGAEPRLSPQSPGRVSKERKAVQMMQAVPEWRALLALVDSFLVAYHLQTLKPLGQVADSKGCSLYAVHAPSYQVCVALKKRVLIIGWNGTFQPRREVNLTDTPRVMACTATACCIALKREYASLSLSMSVGSSAAVTPAKVLDMDREHKHAVITEIPPLPSTPHRRLLVSIGDKGAFLRLPQDEHDDPSRITLAPEDRLTWSAPPKQCIVVLPFLVSLLSNDRVEIHEASSLASLQVIDAPAAPLHICSCPMGVGRTQDAYVVGTGAINILTMVALEIQVEQLVGSALYEEAIAICSMFHHDHAALLANIDLRRIHERYADALFAKNSFDDAVHHYIKADTPVVVVCGRFGLFPEDMPRPRAITMADHHNNNIAALPASQLNRAYHALLVFLQHHRQSVKEAADRAEVQRSALGRGGPPRDDEDVDEAVATAVMVDTMVVVCALKCRPPRTDEPVQLLSGPNRCHIDSCYPLLAAEGPQFVEALLWLYRSKGEHRRALGLLTEAKCVSRERGKGWGIAEMHRWWSDYIRSLWVSVDPQHAQLVMQHLRPLLDANPKLGLRVLIGSSEEDAAGSTAGNGTGDAGVVGGVGVSPVDVVNLLKTAMPRVAPQDWNGPGGLKKASRSIMYRGLPLVSGTTLAVAYVEWVLSTGEAPADRHLHDDYFLLLLTAILTEDKTAAQQGRPASEDGESPTELGRVFQEKLRDFLRTSTQYHPERLLPALEGLPARFLHEKALLLSKLGRHEEVFGIYVTQLKNYELAEAYCDDIWRRTHTRPTSNNTSSGTAVVADGSSRGSRRLSGTSFSAASPLSAAATAVTVTGKPSKEDAEVYLALLKVYLREDSIQSGDSGVEESKGVGTATPRWLSFLERNYARIDAVQVLQLLPERTTSLKALNSYLCKVLRHCATERRYKEVVHQLLRVEELKIQQELIQEQCRMVTVTEATVCRVCRRPIGSTAILCYPNEVIVHFACGRNDLTTCPVTGERFSSTARTSGLL